MEEARSQAREVETLDRILRRRAEEMGDRSAFTFLRDGTVESERLTYAELDRRARAIAASLQAVAGPGDRALLLYPPGLEFVAAFFGCLYAGVTAVPAYPPRSQRQDPRLKAIAADALPRVVLTTSALRADAAASVPAALQLATDALPGDLAAGWRDPGLTGDTLALLQYTSGSTATPKGVEVTHANLAHNEEMIRLAFEQSEDSVVVGWLPLYHDMGLIGGVLQPLYAGGHCVLMSPMAFLQRPARWLEAISRYRGTTSGGPNFAYDLCVRKVPAAVRETLDLSSWRVAFSGAEPVRAETLERFTSTFAPCGFQRRAFFPCYGLAEATLFVTGGAPAEEPVVAAWSGPALEEGRVEAAAGGRPLVGCGRPFQGQTVAIADPESGAECPPGRVGEIWVAGPSVARGYWNQPEQTARDFHARLAGRPGAGPFLRTGDLGFLAGGELFVAGRLKDLIIIRGRNHYPQDLEAAAEASHPALRPGGSAAFSIDDGEERLTLVLELDRRREKEAAEVADAVRRAVSELHELQVHEVVLIRAGTLPKTSSGKVQRRESRRLLAAGELAVVHRGALDAGALDEEGAGGAEPAGALDLPAIEERVRQLAAKALRVPASRLAAGQELTAFGLDSLAAMELHTAIEDELGVAPSIGSLLGGATLAELAAEVARGSGAPAPGSRPPLGLPSGDGDLPLTAGQRGIWLTCRLAPQEAAYNIAAAARLGAVDAEALRRALTALVERHPALRTTFHETETGPVQRVGEAAVDFTRLHAAGWSAERVAERLRSEAARPFDLSAGPLLRVGLLELGPGEHAVGLTVHHLVADFASLAILARELGPLYDRERGLGEAGLEPEPAPYAAHAERQRRWLEGPAGERLWEYWRRQLAGLPEVTELPADRPRPPVQTFGAGAESARLPAELATRLRELAGRRRVSLFTVLLAGFQALVHRYTGQEDLAVGSPAAGRTAAELSGTVGYFVNPLVLRAGLGDAPAFSALLERVQRAVVGGLEHQEYPFPSLVERLAPARDPSRPPLVQLLFALQRAPGGDDALTAFALGRPGGRLRTGGLELESLALDPPGVAFDLGLHMGSLGDGLDAAVHYNRDLFDAGSVRRLLDHLERLLASAVERPEAPVGDLALLSAAERHQLLRAGSGAPLDLGPEALLHGLFAAQAARTPEAPALYAGAAVLSYGELAERAGRLAGRLRRLGVGPEERVGVLLPRSADLVVAVLGVLAAGGAYVGLDPEYPAERLGWIVEDAEIRFLLTDESCLERLPESARSRVEPLRVEAPESGEPAAAGRMLDPDPESLAYLIYTSGSTGRPKGVAVTHRNAAALVAWARGVWSGEELAGVLASTSINFDLSVFELFVPLALGGAVVLAPGALELPWLPAASRVTLINTVPSILAELLRQGPLPAGVWTVNLAGEALPEPLAERLFAQPGVRRVLNLYGPSEDTTYSTWADLERGVGGPPPIGHPVAGTWAYVLDGRGEPVPAGLAGELHLGGAGLARGYLGRPGLTAERFVPDPFRGEPGARMYRTGDRALYRASGDLGFLGRLDHQVKVRGVRIELGEIEAALLEHPGVEQAAVIVREDGGGDPRLVAYMTGTAEPADLDQRLRRRLPGPMVPSAFVRLQALPLTPNGKLDRRALPEPAGGAAAGPGRAPSGPDEELVAAVWREVLGVERLGAGDSFFDLGGQSLLGTRVLSRLRRACGVEIPLRSLFESPTVAGLAVRVAAARAAGGTATAPPVEPVAGDGPAPLSFSQERLWFLSQISGDGAAYNVCGALLLTGPLRREALAASLREIVRRQGSLRTTFAVQGGLPVQVVAPPGPWHLPVVDLRGLPADRRRAAALGLSQDEADRAFDLARGPLFRAALLILGEGEHALLLNLHHIISDGWSLGVLTREIEALYAAASGGGAGLPPLPVSYADFARWQRRLLTGEELAAQLDFWRRRFADGQQVLALPTDRPRPPVQTFRGAHREWRVPAGAIAAVERLSGAESATPFMTYLAVLFALLQRYTAQTDLTVGTFIANRNRAETEGLIGFFVNNLALRVGVPAAGSFRELLAGVRETTFAAYAHQDLPFESLLAELKLERVLDRSPLFQVMLVLQNTPSRALALPGLASAPLPIHRSRSNFDLTLWLEPEGRELTAVAEYNTDLFDAATVDRLLGHFGSLLAGATAAREERLELLPMLAEAERHQIAREWNDTGAGELRPAVHDLVRAQAARTPDAVAVESAGERLTYGELWSRVRHVARRLRGAGVGREALVALLVERSPEMIVGLLGILEAGGAYLPLDPMLPRERLSLLLTDAPVAALLTQERLAGRLPELGAPVLFLDGEPVVAPSAGAGSPGAALPGQLAYLIYTSGSTGRPKAVMVPHGALASYTLSAARHYGLTPGDRVLQFASIVFDASAEEIFPTLARGAALVLRDDAMLASPGDFLRACREREVTVLNLPTSYWHELVADAAAPRLPEAVRLVVIGGEKALPERLEQWPRRAGPEVRLVNTYGPTEATVVATRQELAAAAGLWRVPIGRPVDGALARLLDPELRPVPVGAAGELCLGGAGVARGYLGRPEMTAERFIPDPLANRPGERLYRTGDLARHLPDGTLEFLERSDRQVKLRGYRIELGEIEAVLATHPGIQEAAVVLREDAAGRRQLEGHLAGEGLDLSQVRAYLRERLPEYMVPAAFGAHPALPRTAGGKIDRRALPALERGGGEPERELVPPRTPTEELLAGIWAEVLGISRLGVHDDFFELGGYSLLATQVIARVREACGVELPLAALFEAPTLARLAERIEQAGRTLLPPIERVPRGGDLPLSFSQERVWFLTQLAPNLTAYHVPRALRLAGPMSLPLLAEAYSALLERHEILRTTFPTVGGQPVQRILPPAKLRMPVVDLSALPAELREREVPVRILDLGQQLFDLANGPLLRAAALRLGELDHVVVQTEHHMVHDGWAEGILVRDLLGFYNGLVAGVPAALPPLPIQFADFACWQRRWLQGEVLEEQLAYWRERLAGAPALLELPTDRPRLPVQGSSGGERELHLSSALLRGVQELAGRNRVTLFMATLAAFEAVLQRWSGQDDLVLGTGIANRRRSETEGLLGMIINSVPLRTRFPASLDGRALLAQIRDTCMGAYAHQDVPFEKVVEALQPQRSLSYTPLFQVMFAFHDGPPRVLEIPGVVVTPLESHNRSSKFDILVIAVPQRRRGGDDGVTELAFYFEYDSDLFDGPTVARLLSHFENALWAMVRDDGQEIAALPLLSAAEAHQLGREWGETYPLEPDGATLPGLFAAQAARTPEAPALTCGGETLSYAELAGRAGRLARRLRGLGVGVESRVGICLERRSELVVAILAVLEAGGAYVPLDPAYPQERLAFILADCGAALLLTSEELRGRLPAGDLPVLCLPVDGEDGSGGPAPRTSAAAGSGNLAYAIYTSGSTGRPKGVAVEHRSAVALVRWARDTFAPEELAGVLFSTSVCFDLSVFEVFVPLSSGGRVILAENILHLTAIPAAAEVTLINTVPSGLAELLRVGGLRFAAAVTVNLAGEALPGSLVRQLHARPDVRRVLNLYGPSEDTVYSTAAVIAPGEAVPPIGRPISGTRSHVLDGRYQAAPIGVPGELCLGGEGLARGYLFRPDLTAERFIPDPFADAPGARLYRTGDRVRLRPTGEIDFLGRVDHQVKVRGFRIELEEIEALLDRHPDVRECVVVLRGAAGDAQLVAYVVPNAGDAAAREALPRTLRRFLQESLPAYMVPSTFLVLEALARTPNGKVDRKALPDPAGSAAGRELRLPASELERRIAAVWQRLLGVERVGVHDNFFDLGAHSLLMVRAFQELRGLLGDRVGLLELFRYPSVAALAEFLDPRKGAPPRAEPAAVRAEARRAAAEGEREGIAIIGVKGRFPRAASVEELWRNLSEGVEAVTFFSDEELLARGVPPALLRDPAYVKADAVLEGADLFDAPFFGYSPREARIMDPQQRLFLECTWGALEDAGYDPGRFAGAIGVFAGVSANRYWLNLFSNAELTAGENGYLAMVGNDKDFLATRVSYKLNLKGPSLNVQTACSTSLVAVHLACQSLLRGECDMALAGGASVNALQGMGYPYTPGGIASPDGHCRAFDAAARGTIGGNGLAVVVLKRLSAAVADGDSIRAVIRGSALNNDGSDKVGYTAPSVAGQAAVVAEAQLVAGVEPEWIDYVEAHGTGTEVGDPIEIAALSEAFRRRTERTGYCAIGSVKPNIGHLDAAAGITGLVKTVLALEHRQIPPSLNYERPNPAIDFARSPFYVNTRLAPWPAPDGRRRLAAVSSFGLGGTNAHAIVEEAPEAAPSGPSRPLQLLVLSAKTPTALETATDNLVRHLERHPDLPLADVAFTLQAGRSRLAHRRALVCRDLDDARRALASRDPERVLSQVRDAEPGRVVFLFPGTGAQYPGMGLDLYRAEPVFQQAADECLELFAPWLDSPLRPLLYPAAAAAGAAADPLRRTASAQPALFVTEYALAKLCLSWGLQPGAMIGHSFGEYVAACLAGVLSLPDAVALVALRGRLLAELPPGAMLSVPLSEAELLPLLGDGLSIAALNGPALSVLSGPVAAVAAAQEALAARGVEARRLHTDAALHSPLVEPILPAFRSFVQRLELRPPQIPFVSSATGAWIRDEEATDPEYWVRHLRRTVRFGEGLAVLLAEPGTVLLEIGPGRTLCTLARRHPARTAEHGIFSLLRAGGETAPDLEPTFDALARLWLRGLPVDGLHAAERRRRVPLPGYPFEGRRYWIEARRADALAAPAGKRPDPADWFYTPAWRPSPPPVPAAGEDRPPSRWLLLVDGSDLGTALADGLRRRGHEVATAAVGAGFARLAPGAYAIAPGRPEDYLALLADLHGGGGSPQRIVHLWTAGPAEPAATAGAVAEAQQRGFLSLVFLGQALEKSQAAGPVRIDAVSSGLWQVEPAEPSRPEVAPLLAACLVLPQEYPDLVCRAIDPGPPDGAGRAEGLLAEILANSADLAVAYRRGCRLVRSLVPLRLDRTGPAPVLRQGGVYWITGGLGRVGRSLALYLARETGARLILSGRSPLPPREEWEEWRRTRGEADPVSRRIQGIRDLEALGAEVLDCAADVADEAQVRAVVELAERRFGRLDGVVHAAGVVGEKTHRSVGETGPEELGWHFRPKVLGTLALARVLQERELDFCLLVSSLSTVLGGLGLSAYAAANLFLNAFAGRMSRQGRTPWMSLVSDAWQPEREGEAGGGAGAGLAELAMTSDEGAAAFGRALWMLGSPEVVVSTSSLDARMGQWLHAAPEPVEERAAEAAGADLRPDLPNPYVAPRDATEEGVAEVWRQLLGLERVGVHDSFFALGGDSLLATRLASGLRRRFHTEIPLRGLFDQPTIAGQSTLVSAQAARGGRRGPAAIERRSRNILEQLQDLDSLADDPADRVLDRESL